MNYLGKTIEELHHLLVEKKVTPLELTKDVIEALKKENTNAIETLCEEEALAFASSLKEPETDNYFWGIPYVAKDNFSTKGILTTGSSEILKDYVPVFDATVIAKLKEKKAILVWMNLRWVVLVLHHIKELHIILMIQLINIGLGDLLVDLPV
jgi:aspartyl-tRNA(Asn)/glutamyl-tRNA(Gln) amidotransferase subunit A